MNLSASAVVRGGLLLTLLFITTGYWYCRIDAIRTQYGKSEVKQNAEQELSSGLKEALAEMTRQNELLANWGVIALGGLIALIVTTRVHAIPYIGWIYLLLVPAASLLLGSLWAGVIFQRRLTYLVLKGVASIESLNNLLAAQSDFLELAIIVLSVFATVFLLNIVLGKVIPVEKK